MTEPDVPPNRPSGADRTISWEGYGHSLTIYPDGQERLKALRRAIAMAQTRLRLCFYIFADDACGESIRDDLADAARRGVEVTLLIDGFGSSKTPDAFFAPMTEAGAQFARFIARKTRRYLIRNHQKIVLVDDRVALFGGFNVEDSYFAPPAQDGWHDLGVWLEGDAVNELVGWYDKLAEWTRSPRQQFRAIRRLVREWEPGEGPLRWLVGGPTNGLSPWARDVSTMLMRGSRLDMMMAYFTPSPRLLRRIDTIAGRKGACIVMSGKSDNTTTIAASRLLYPGLLKKGAQLWEFDESKMHTKLMVIDDSVFLGSANFDMRSLYINLEIMLRIDDAGLARTMRNFLKEEQERSRRISLKTYRRHTGPIEKLRQLFSWLLVGFADYTVSRRLNFRLGPLLPPAVDDD